VNATGSSDASSLDSTYNFTAGNYTYTISGFAAGDKLNFPTENTPTIINDDFTDGKVTLQWAADGDVIDVILTGLPEATDATIYGADSFRTAYGSASLSPTSVSTNITEVTASNTDADDASSSDKYYLIKTNLNNTYTYKISGFGAGDTIDFPDGNEPTVVNTDFTDGNVTLQWAYNGSVVDVVLSGISEQNDGAIFGLTSFKSKFGESSVK